MATHTTTEALKDNYGFAMVRTTITETDTIFVVYATAPKGVSLDARTPLVRGTTLEDAQECARFTRDKMGASNVRLAREVATFITSDTDYINDDVAEAAELAREYYEC